MGVARIRNAMRVMSIVRARSFQRLFLDSDGKPQRGDAQRVLGNLARFARADRSTFDPDPYVSARLQGRREMWLRINGYLNLDEDQVQQSMEIDDGE